MKWFFTQYKKHKTIVLTLLAVIGTPTTLVMSGALEVADKFHDEARATLGKSPVPEPAPAPELPAQPEKSDDAAGI